MSLVYMPVTASNLEQLKSTTLCVCVWESEYVDVTWWPEEKNVNVKELKEIQEQQEFLCAHVQVLLTERGIPCDIFL